MPPAASDWRSERVVDGLLRLSLRVHAQPGAKRSEVTGLHGGALKIRLAAPPLEGRANAELIRYLAECFGVPQRAVTVLRGTSSRHKLVQIDAPARRPDAAWASEAGHQRK